MEIRILHKQSKSIHAIARELSVSRGTVRKYLRQPGLSAGYGPRKGRASKLDPFKDYLRDRIRNAAPRRLPATVYLREIRALGYDGGITILKGWLLTERPVELASAMILLLEHCQKPPENICIELYIRSHLQLRIEVHRM